MVKLLPFEYAVRNLGRAPTRTLLCVLGAMLVVFLILGAGAFVQGLNSSLTDTSQQQNVIILGTGSEESIERSEVDLRVASVVASSLKLRTRLGVPYVSPEVHMALAVKTREDLPKGTLTVIRGIRPSAYLVHPRVQIVAGAAPQRGQDEIMVGEWVSAKLGIRALGVGDQLWIDGRPWRVSGLLSAPQSVMNGEIWMPLEDLQVLARRDTLSCVVATLAPGSTLSDVELLAAQRLDLEISATTEQRYYQKLSQLYAPIRFLIMTTSLLIALGALLGGLNTIYAAFATRVREVGTLQTLGYARRAIVLSLLQETLLTSVIGALIAAALALMILDGWAVRFSMGAFALVVDAPVLTTGLLAGAGIGLIGALPPTLRWLRFPIHEALKS